MSDPNFPPSLDIHPFIVPDVSYVPEDQKQDIALYGIAGRVWEASKPLIRYFTPSLQSSFDPPCPIFQHTPPRKIIELGSGQALASLHLAQQLEDADTLVLTDLPNVVPLCEQSALSWSVKNPKAGQVSVRPLAWGGDCSSALSLGPFDYIIMCDLVSRDSVDFAHPDLLSASIPSPAPHPASTHRKQRITFSWSYLWSYHRIVV